MFAKVISRVSCQKARTFSSTGICQTKVAVLGAAGGIGQPLSLLLKQNDQISHLSLFDIVHTPGVAADLSHCPTSCKIAGFKGMEDIGKALDSCDVVLIPAGVPRKPGMSRDDLFNTNATIVQNLARQTAKYCPKAMLLIIANPVNSTVPIVAEVYKKAGVYDPKKLFGVTTLDVCRANTFVSEIQGWNVNDVNVTVIGGHAGTTILPLLSQIKNAKWSEDVLKALYHRIQFGGDEVVAAKDGAGSATLSMAFAAAVFTKNLLAAMNGAQNVVQCTMTENTITPAAFFATPTLLGKNGAEKCLPYGTLSKFEQETFDKMLPDLLGQIKKGKEFSS